MTHLDEIGDYLWNTSSHCELLTVLLLIFPPPLRGDLRLSGFFLCHGVKLSISVFGGSFSCHIRRKSWDDFLWHFHCNFNKICHQAIFHLHTFLVEPPKMFFPALCNCITREGKNFSSCRKFSAWLISIGCGTCWNGKRGKTFWEGGQKLETFGQKLLPQNDDIAMRQVQVWIDTPSTEVCAKVINQIPGKEWVPGLQFDGAFLTGELWGKQVGLDKIEMLSLFLTITKGKSSHQNFSPRGIECDKKSVHLF